MGVGRRLRVAAALLALAAAGSDGTSVLPPKKIRGRRHSLDPRDKPAFDTALLPPEGVAMDDIA